KELGLDVVEWLNTQSSKHSVASTLEYDDSSVGVVKQFEDFLLRAERYSSLALSSTGSSRTTNVIQSASRRSSGQIILVDDLPNISHKDTRDSFRSALLKFISIPARRSFPMVIVVTEAFAAHNVLEDSGEFGAVGGRLRENDKSSHSEIGIWCASDILPSAVFNSPYCHAYCRFNRD
ncbi:RFC checkpoint protein Rad17, partial [Dipsacomyces acuminosporus]